MGIADIRAALALALQPVGTVSNVTMKYGAGGRNQHIHFNFTPSATNKNKAKGTTQEELVVPSSSPLLIGLQQAAAVFVANHELENAK